MTPQEAIAYIENYTWSTTRLGLERTQALLHALGNPQKELKFIHVAGSNGKGSTCAMLESILRCAGYRTGLYISPYIQDFCERIQVDGENISGEDLAELTQTVRDIADGMEDHPSQFELVTAIAMAYFRRMGCQMVVLEVGLGGALDSTNAIDAPEVAVICNIGLEHTEYLGNTLGEIAAAKGGIIKTGCDVVAYPGPPEVMGVLERIAREQRTPLHVAQVEKLHPLAETLDGQQFDWGDWKDLHLPLLGPHQLYNAAVVLEVVETLRRRGWNISDQAVREGLAHTQWPARMEVLCRDPLFILDGGHNPQCAQALRASLERLLPGRNVVFLTGVLADKDYGGILREMFPLAQEFVCLTPLSPRALPAGELADFLTAQGVKAIPCATVAEGIRQALSAAGEDGVVVAFGSLYLAGAVRSAFPGVYRKWLRRDKIRARDALSPEERERLSGELVTRLVSSPEFQGAGTVLIYRATRGEVRLEGLETAPEAQGKRLAYPLCVSDTEMIALVPRGENAWVDGYYGIREPDRDKSDLIAPEDIDLVVCPCTVFDQQCHRMGMGAGFYDRYLPQCVNAAVAAVAFECQKAAQVPVSPWDRPMDMVLTEQRIYRADCPAEEKR